MFFQMAGMMNDMQQMMQAHSFYFGYGWLLQILIVLLFLLVFWWVFNGLKTEKPKEILDSRLAKGEITLKEYKDLLKEIGDN